MFSRSMFRMVKPTPLAFRMVASTPMRVFGHTKYTFDDEDWNPTITQLSAETHATNAEELINNLPIIEVKGNVVRCTGV